MKRWVILCLLMIPFLMTPCLASADSYWDGNAAVQRGDAAFESGLYAASNSFPPDTRLKVQNLENGKSAIVTVSQRTDDQSGLLILLSPKAADAVGIAPGSITQVRVTVQQQAASTGASAAPEGTYNPDSDVNPGAAYAGAPGTAQQTGAQDQQAAGQAQQSAGHQPSAQDQQSAAQAQQPAAQPQSAAQAQQPPAAAQSAEDAEILAEAASRNPQKQLFLPPREDQKFAYKPSTPEQTASAAEAPTQPAQGETPSVSGETASPSGAQSQVPLAEAQPQQQPTPQEAASSAAQPSQPEAGAQVALNPPQTPAEQPTSAPVTQATPERQPGQAQVVSSLPRLTGKKNTATFYVQLGAYATQEVAQGLAVSLMQTYPVLVLAPASGAKQMYRVLIGPLNKAESGTLLPVFKFKGFRDAFVRRE
ncbi:MAG: SPOR domain-containing protein [Spirochaetia bacterium]